METDMEIKDMSEYMGISVVKLKHMTVTPLIKGNRTLADLRYGYEVSISPITLISAAIKG